MTETDFGGIVARIDKGIGDIKKNVDVLFGKVDKLSGQISDIRIGQAEAHLNELWPELKLLRDKYDTLNTSAAVDRKVTDGLTWFHKLLIATVVTQFIALGFFVIKHFIK